MDERFNFQHTHKHNVKCKLEQFNVVETLGNRHSPDDDEGEERCILCGKIFDSIKPELKSIESRFEHII